MKPQTIQALLAVAIMAGLNQPSSSSFAQGSLTPPAGAPAPVMKSLDQIEARTPVNTLAGDATASHIITLPGSYYLTGPLTGHSGKTGIRIEADNVTLDLNGFTLEAVGGSLIGIQINLSAGQVNIRNGQLRFWPNGGILSTQAVNCAIENLAIRSVGGPGLQLAAPATLRCVQVRGAVGFGINAKNSVISDCVVEDVVAAPGSIATAGILTEGGTVLSSFVRNISGTGGLTRGIGAGVVRDCTVEGIQTTAGHASGINAAVTDNTGTAVITGTAENCRVRNITASGTASGIYYFGTTRGCAVSSIIATNGSGGATGIYGPNVSESQVLSVLASADASGISGNNVVDCFVQFIKNTNGGNSSGIVLDDGFATFRSGVARHCTVRGGGKYGIFAMNGNIVTGCSVTSIDAPYYPTVTGYYAYGNGNIFDGNTAVECSTGFSTKSGNLYKGNSAHANFGANYSGGNAVIVSSPSNATNAFSNFSF